MMEVGDTVELTEDATTGRGAKIRVYGAKGSKVKITAIHDQVLIVEGKERFPIHISKVK